MEQKTFDALLDALDKIFKANPSSNDLSAERERMAKVNTQYMQWMAETHPELITYKNGKAEMDRKKVPDIIPLLLASPTPYTKSSAALIKLKELELSGGSDAIVRFLLDNGPAGTNDRGNSTKKTPNKPTP